MHLQFKERKRIRNVGKAAEEKYIVSIKFTEQDIVSRKAVAAKSHYIEFLKSWVNRLEDRILHFPEDILCRAGIEEKMELMEI